MSKQSPDKSSADELLREAAKSIRQLTFGDTEEQGWWVPEQRRANKVRERIEEFLNAYTPSHVGQKGNYDPNESPEAKAVRLAKVAKFVAACQLGDAVGIREQIFAPPEWFGLTETPLADVLREHYLAHITCDHGTKQDNPVCACSKVNLGWHPSVGQAIEAWLAHVMVEIKTRCAASTTPRKSDRLLGRMIQAWFGKELPDDPAPTRDTHEKEFFERMGRVYDVMQRASEGTTASAIACSADTARLEWLTQHPEIRAIGEGHQRLSLEEFRSKLDHYMQLVPLFRSTDGTAKTP